MTSPAELFTLLAQAQEQAPSQSPLDLASPFINVGIVGIILLCIVFKKYFVPEWVLREAEERHKTELAARDADIAELKQMVADGAKQYNEQVIPAFTRSIDVNREYVELLRDRQSLGR